MKTGFALPSLSDTLLAIAGAVLCGTGSGFMNHASLGMDAIGLFYDGIRNILALSPAQIGTASYAVCFILSVFLWFAARKYVSFGSVIYITAYGLFANLGTMLAEIIIPDILWLRIVSGVTGYLVLCAGLAVYIAIDIGVDAFTGVILWICDLTHKELKTIKIIFDLCLTVIGVLLGGTLGVFTVVAVIIGGPVIDFLTKRFQVIYFKWKLRRDMLG